MMSGTFTFWIDAKHHAAEESAFFGHAWIVRGRNEEDYYVISSEFSEDAPEEFLAEFMDGEEQ